MTKPVATRDAYGEALRDLGASNKDVVVLDADLSKSTKTSVFAQAFSERFFDMGIAEQNLMGTAAGLAAAGKIPFASTFAIFATGRAYEQVRNSICYPRLNVKIAATHAGLTVGEDGASHQALEDISLMRGLPHMTVIVPADAAETRAAVAFAAAYRGPVYIRLGRMAVPAVFGDDYEFQHGRAVTLADGKDVTLMATGIMVSRARQAAQALYEQGLTARVLAVATIKPLDSEAVAAAARDTGAVVTCEEHSIIGGLGSAVAETLAEHCPAPLERVGVRDTFGESGRPEELLDKYHLAVADIVQAARRAIARKG